MKSGQKIRLIGRSAALSAVVTLLAIIVPSGRTADMANEWQGGGGVVVPSYSDSSDFDIDAALTFGEPGYADSPFFDIDTLFSISTPGFATSGFFSVNTKLTRRNPSFATSGNMAMDTRRVNRAWADSATFSFMNDLGCVGSYAGNYSGGSSGTVLASLGCDNTLSITFVSALGPVLFSEAGTVQADGSVSGGQLGVTFAGTFNLTQCTATGTWQHSSGLSGSWNLTRTAAGSCNPAVLVVAPSNLNLGTGSGIGLFAVVNTGAGSMAYSAAITPTVPWMQIGIGSTGVNAGLVWFVYTANPNTDPRVSTIRVTAPGATPGFVDITVTQAGTAPQVLPTHFEFDPIAGPYNVDEPIPVTIRAMSSASALAAPTPVDFCGRVDLAPLVGDAQVSPRYVNMCGGSWNGNVKFNMPSPTTVLSAWHGSFRGESGPFGINPGNTQLGRVEGFVEDQDGVSQFDAEVRLLTPSGSVAYTTITYAIPFFGQYSFTGVTPGHYKLQAIKGTTVSVSRSIYIPPGTTAPEPLVLFPTDKRPVLLVGGLAGTTRKEADSFYPTLGSARMPARGDLELYDPVPAFTPVWSTLRNVLDEDFLVINVPWDWRKPVDEALITTYLTPVIDEIKSICNPPCEKIRVVAHSMGGLLVRRYIQSDLYATRQDIDRFAMCGTPNGGASIAYYIWEGGDPRRADNIQEPWFIELVNFYSYTYDNIYRGIYGSNGIVSGSTNDLNATSLLPWRDHDRVFATLRVHAKGLGELMPIYAFLKRSSEDPVAATFERMTVTQYLASDPRKNLLASEFDNDPAKVRTKIFYSDRMNTVSRIEVGPPGTVGQFPYPSGTPRDEQPIKELCGDETVPAYSALHKLPLQVSRYSGTGSVSHSSIMSAYADEICRFLNDNNPCGSSGRTEERVTGEKRVLGVGLTGRVQPLLRDPTGLTVGVNLNGAVEMYVQGSHVVVGSGGAMIRVEQPLNGAYQLLINAAGGETFSLVVSLLRNDQQAEVRMNGVGNDLPVEVDLNVNWSAFPISAETDTKAVRRSERKSPIAATPVLAILGPVLPPTNIRATNVNGLARIEWDASPDPMATSYNVYGRPDDQPRYTLLGSSNGTFFDTNHVWVSQGVGVLWNYFVVAAAGDGTESLFNSVVENQSPLIARMFAKVTTGVEPFTVNFLDTSAGQVSARAWDFESDGIIDSTEQNPIHEFTTAGSYTVSLTVGGPEGTDTSVRVGFVTVDPLVPPPPVIPGDSDGDQMVTLLDFGAFVDYLLGPFEDPQLAGWHHFDFDGDYDVDLADFAELQNEFLVSTD